MLEQEKNSHNNIPIVLTVLHDFTHITFVLNIFYVYNSYVKNMKILYNFI